MTSPSGAPGMTWGFRVDESPYSEAPQDKSWWQKVQSSVARPVMLKLDALLRREFIQIESLIGLYSTLDISVPLPPTRAWAASPDFIREVVTRIARLMPGTVVELGSGVSTLLIAYALRRNGAGHVYSVEHSADWAEESRQRLHDHGLSSYGTVIHAPVRSVPIGDVEWRWYDTNELQGLEGIDMLVIDGPPHHLQSMARYPALPLMKPRLAAHAVVLLDDADRTDELAIVQRWSAEFGPVSVERPHTEKGLAVLSWPSAKGSRQVASDSDRL